MAFVGYAHASRSTEFYTKTCHRDTDTTQFAYSDAVCACTCRFEARGGVYKTQQLNYVVRYDIAVIRRVIVRDC